MNRSSCFFLLLFLLPLVSVCGASRVKIACVSNDLTSIPYVQNRELEIYPTQLQESLGANFLVKSFSFTDQDLFDFSPDIVFISLGTTDFHQVEKFESKLLDLVTKCQTLCHSRIILMSPVRSFFAGNSGILDSYLKKLNPMVQQIAQDRHLEFIDLYPILECEHYTNKPVPLVEGVLASYLSMYLNVERCDFNIFEQEGLEGGQSFYFHGFRGKRFKENDLDFMIVQPQKSTATHPWIIRARFWDHEPQLDIKLLEMGFHLVYCDVVDLFGSPLAVDRWDKLYAKMQSLGMSEKVVLEGMSRGGVIVYNWALKNPEKVSAIYVDAPLLDFKSNPFGQGILPRYNGDAKRIMKAYGMTEKELLAYRNNPLDNAEKIAQFDIPLVHVIGLADNAVPIRENTLPFAQRIRKAGGQITLIKKSGVGHHPASLSNPLPLINFILKAQGLYVKPFIRPIPAYECGVGPKVWNYRFPFS